VEGIYWVLLIKGERLQDEGEGGVGVNVGFSWLDHLVRRVQNGRRDAGEF